MRNIEVIQTDIENVKKLVRPDHDYHRAFEALDEELRAAYTDGIPIDRLEAICAAEREGRLVELPWKRGDRIYIVDGKVKGSIRVTRLESYLTYAENPTRIYVKCTANSAWHDMSNVYSIREAAEAALAQEGENQCLNKFKRR